MHFVVTVLILMAALYLSKMIKNAQHNFPIVVAVFLQKKNNVDLNMQLQFDIN